MNNIDPFVLRIKLKKNNFRNRVFGKSHYLKKSNYLIGILDEGRLFNMGITKGAPPQAARKIKPSRAQKRNIRKEEEKQEEEEIVWKGEQ